MGVFSSLKRIAASDVIAGSRKRGDASKVAAALNKKSTDRVRDWARPAPDEQNESATGRPSPFQNWLNHFQKYFDRAELQIEAESDETAFALMRYAVNRMWWNRFAKRGLRYSEKERERLAFRLCSLTQQFYRFVSLNDFDKARTTWVRITATVPRCEYALWQPQAM